MITTAVYFLRVFLGPFLFGCTPRAARTAQQARTLLQIRPLIICTASQTATSASASISSKSVMSITLRPTYSTQLVELRVLRSDHHQHDPADKRQPAQQG